jgi:anaerobic selenocysteine-containing dehydrogenase
MGVSTQAYGGLNQWLIQLINIATGNLDKAGGSLFTLPAVDQPRRGPDTRPVHRRRQPGTVHAQRAPVG